MTQTQTEAHVVPQRSADRRPWLFGVSALVLALDRVTKHLIDTRLALGDGIPIIPRVLRISHVLNTGAAFSLFGDSQSPERVRWLLVAFSLIAAAVVVGVIVKMGRRVTLTTFALALILGGAIGNAWDRIRTGSVIDFIEVHIVHYHWPDFNLADSAIVIGGILLVLDSLRAGKEEAATGDA